jgi:phospho-N-acetylmuramoyl-pentapeptide-transferase
LYDFTSAVYAVLLSFAVCVALLPGAIPLLRRLKFGQNVRDDGPKTHLAKQGVPTMGGLAIVVSFGAACLFFLKDNPDALAVLAVTVSSAAIGFIDDYIKVVKKRSLGLRAGMKVIFQLVVCAGFWLYLYFSQVGSEVYIPFLNIYWDMGLLYVPFYLLVMVGIVNAVNITDGADGLASGVTVLVAAFFLFVSLAMGSGLVPAAGAAVGALLGFLLFNSHPAKIIMGDTGSFALGGFVAATSIILKMPLVLAIVGLVYIVENISVMLQVGWFKYTKRKYGEGRRLFKMAPLHHHFEVSGWRETQVVTLFYVATAVCCLIGYIAARGAFRG